MFQFTSLQYKNHLIEWSYTEVHKNYHLDSLAVHVGQLLHFQGALKAGGKVESPSHDQKTSLLIKLLCYLKNLGIQGQNSPVEKNHVSECRLLST